MSAFPTPRYPHGILPQSQHVAFLEEYYATRLLGPFKPSTRKGKQRGEVIHLRSALRTKFPGWHSNIRTIREAMKLKPEWRKWCEEVFEERKVKLKGRKEKKKKDKKTGRKLKQTKVVPVETEDGDEEDEEGPQ